MPQAANPASIEVAERLGMRFPRPVAIQPIAVRGPLEARLFELTADEWASGRGGSARR